MNGAIDDNSNDGGGKAPKDGMAAAAVGIMDHEEDEDSKKMPPPPATPVVVSLTELFPPDQVRNKLYRQEPKLSRIPPKAASLIGTTSALFLQDLVKRAAASEQETSQGHIIKCTHVYRAVQDKESFDFVKEVLEENGIDKLIQKEQASYGEYVPRKKRSRKDTASSRTAKKVMEAAAQPKEGLEAALASSSANDQIIVDEDDYD